METYLIGIGKKIKDIRKTKKFTILQVAQKAQVSNGLISKIENGRTIPSLPVLLNLISALDIEVAEFFNSLVQSQKTNYLLFKSEEYPLIEKEEKAIGFEYRSIYAQQLMSCGFEAVLLELKSGAKRDKVQTDAFEFKYVISGACTYLIQDDVVELTQGDALFFDGRIPHVPRNESNTSCLMLVLYFFYTKNE